jgi:hypothetical protein
MELGCEEKLTKAEALVEHLALQAGVKLPGSDEPKGTKIAKENPKATEQQVTASLPGSPGSQVQQEKFDKDKALKDGSEQRNKVFSFFFSFFFILF